MEDGPAGSHGQGGAFLFGLIAIFLVACGGKWRPQPFNLDAHVPTPALQGSETLLFEQAILARQNGDAVGAIARLSSLWKRGSQETRVLYQLGIAFEVAEDFPTAAAIYSQIKAQEEDPFLLRDATFRLALCLWELDAVVEHADVACWPGPHVAHSRQDDGPFTARFGTRASKLTTFEVLTYPPPRNCRVQIRIKLPVGIEWYLYFNSLCALR